MNHSAGLPGDDLLTLALKNCEQEAIHLIGAIQPEACMLIVDPRSFLIKRVSKNSALHLGKEPQEILGRDVRELLGHALILGLLDHLQQGSWRTLIQRSITILGIKFELNAHMLDQQLIIELEREAVACQQGQKVDIESGMLEVDPSLMGELIRDFTQSQLHCTCLEQLYNHTVDWIRRISGFDRVKIYQFDTEWNGAVVAESRADFMPSYLGLRFPASDIPRQARQLYTRNPTRQIINVDDPPVPLVGDEELRPIDMSFCQMRSVSPIHIQYLKNMGVKASFSLSVLQNGKLWGLIACHHAEPKHVMPKVRLIMEVMCHIFSAQLMSLEDGEDRVLNQKRLFLAEQLETALYSEKDLKEFLKSRSKMMLESIDACGFAVFVEGTWLRYGKVPSAETLDAIVTSIGSDTVVAVSDLSKVYGHGSKVHEVRGGVLAISIDLGVKSQLLWFREPIRSTIKWAGKPQKVIETAKGEHRLLPRASFEMWEEMVGDASKVWSRFDIEAATNVGLVISELHRNMENQIAKRDFLANMSHEMRTPMNAILGVVSIFESQEGFSAEQMQLIKTLRLSSESLLNLINDLLDLSKIQAQQMTLEKLVFSLRELVGELENVMSIRAKEKDLIFSCRNRVDAAKLFVGDPFRIKQVILNLLSNAIKFTEHGLVQLNVSAINPLDRNESELRLRFEVIDTGLGIKSEYIPKLFQKFSQADSSISRRYGGSGLGLAICKHLVELMKGTIEVVSQEGLGSRFIVEIPVKPVAQTTLVRRVSSGLEHDQEEYLHVREPDPLAHSPKTKVLLVEDYPGNIMVMKTILESIGVQVDSALNGSEALQKTREQDYDLVLMDVQMPIMDGYQATRLIREEQKQANKKPVPIIGITANAFQEDRERCLNSGMDDYLSKPLDFSKLKIIIRDLGATQTGLR